MTATGAVRRWVLEQLLGAGIAVDEPALGTPAGLLWFDADRVEIGWLPRAAGQSDRGGSSTPTRPSRIT